ncbi:hypothetical protein M2244_001913 [Rhodoferax antarcticus]|nr:hypothetical protein [Rhodoferax antarcticus]
MHLTAPVMISQLLNRLLHSVVREPDLDTGLALMKCEDCRRYDYSPLHGRAQLRREFLRTGRSGE